jgi:hypothetical protein
MFGGGSFGGGGAGGPFPGSGGGEEGGSGGGGPDIMFDRLISTADRLIQKQKQTRTQLSSSQQVAKQFTNTLGRGLGRSIGQLLTFQSQISSLGGLFQSVGQTIQQALSQVISKLVSAVAQAAALRAAIEFIPGLGQIGGGSSFGGLLGGVLGFAKGGLVQSPTLGVVGEGTEDEAVLPLSRLSAFVQKSAEIGAASVRAQVGGGLLPGLAAGGMIEESGIPKDHKGGAVVNRKMAQQGSQGGTLSASISMDELIFQLDRSLKSKGQPGLLT